ncbi:MAG TPA: phosphotransferase [Acetobacteraceae bacterium]|jgi:hypothetical protein|nr:phosphotransferase [Acetobacteraceae bacterium]
MSRALIIASAAYIDAELQAEFGRLPPSFLPIGNRRLFVHQHAAFRETVSRVILSLPDDFNPGPLDIELLDELGIEIVHVPGGLSLGQSIVYVINVAAAAGEQLAILHGDTLLRGVGHAASDAVSVAPLPSNYAWGEVRVEDGAVHPADDASHRDDPASAVLSGYFVFTEPVRLVQAITRAGGSFLAGLHGYGQSSKLRALAAAEWLDFGHANTYHQSRGRVTTQRAFNDLHATPRLVVKSARDTAKIAAEARWFDRLPPPLRAYAPAFLGMRDTASGPGYALEYLYLPTLADLFVFGRLTPMAWGHIFDACDEYLTACIAYPAPPGTADDAEALYGGKARQRLEELARTTGIDIDAACRFNGQHLPSLRRMAELAAQAVPAAEPGRHMRLVHGDFCFSNILYDARASLVRVIDPRGVTADGQATPYGDVRYDLGKFHHSVVGRYDHILAGYYRLQDHGPTDVTLDLRNDPESRDVEALYRARSLAGFTIESAASHAVSVLLFLSMLPLHADDAQRQRALMANAMRLFLAMETRAAAA